MSHNAKARLGIASEFPNYSRVERLFNFFEHLSTSETPGFDKQTLIRLYWR